MKKYLIIASFLSVKMFSQIENSQYIFKDPKIFTKPSGAIIDLGSSITNLDGYTSGSFNFGLMTDVYKNGLAGFSFNSFSNKNSHYQTPVEVINPKFNFYTFTIDNEYQFFKNKVVGFSIFNKIGIANASLNDAYYQQYYYMGKSSGYRPKQISNQYYFTDEPGASLNINMFKCVSLCAGASYRMVAGAGTYGPASNFNGLNANVKLRFKISDNETKPAEK